jgi:hypothetical protein
VAREDGAALGEALGAGGLGWASTVVPRSVQPRPAPATTSTRSARIAMIEVVRLVRFIGAVSGTVVWLGCPPVWLGGGACWSPPDCRAMGDAGDCDAGNDAGNDAW